MELQLETFPDFRVQIPDFRFQISDFMFHISNLRPAGVQNPDIDAQFARKYYKSTACRAKHNTPLATEQLERQSTECQNKAQKSTTEHSETEPSRSEQNREQHTRPSGSLKMPNTGDSPMSNPALLTYGRRVLL